VVGGPEYLSAPDAVHVWGEEEKDYNCTTNECRPNATCGHYTQLVWNTTLAVGCGMAYCRQNSPFGEQHPNWTFYVCNYTPPGTCPLHPCMPPCGLSAPCADGGAG
jgi:hypothetical protein